MYHNATSGTVGVATGNKQYSRLIKTSINWHISLLLHIIIFKITKIMIKTTELYNLAAYG